MLEIALRDILREELGETYGVSVGLAQPLPQRGAGRISVSFGGAPDKIDRDGRARAARRCSGCSRKGRRRT